MEPVFEKSGHPLTEQLFQTHMTTQVMSRMVDRAARRRIQTLEEKGAQRDREIATLSGRLSRLAPTLETVHPSNPGIEMPPPTPPKPEPAAPSARPRQSPASGSPSTPRPVALIASSVGFSSLIVPQFPPLFAEFHGKGFNLLWRGNRDGFLAKDFHGRCDGHENTLTLIEDTDGNIFGASRRWSGTPEVGIRPIRVGRLRFSR
jgi:hypothetical protein